MIRYWYRSNTGGRRWYKYQWTVQENHLFVFIALTLLVGTSGLYKYHIQLLQKVFRDTFGGHGLTWVKSGQLKEKSQRKSCQSDAKTAVCSQEVSIVMYDVCESCAV